MASRLLVCQTAPLGHAGGKDAATLNLYCAPSHKGERHTCVPTQTQIRDEKGRSTLQWYTETNPLRTVFVSLSPRNMLFAYQPLLLEASNVSGRSLPLPHLNLLETGPGTFCLHSTTEVESLKSSLSVGCRTWQTGKLS